MVHHAENNATELDPLPKIEDSEAIWKRLRESGIDRYKILAGSELNMHYFDKLLKEVLPSLGLSPNFVSGFIQFIKKPPRNLYRLIKKPEDIEALYRFCLKLNKLTQGRDFFNSTSIVFIYESQDFGEILDQFANNAEFMIETFGLDFFSKDPEFQNRATYYVAQIPGTDFYLTCKGASGSGTFSVDFAITSPPRHNNYPHGEIWRSGFDTEGNSDETRKLRIIRSGPGVKGEDSHGPSKEFFKTLKITPQRALAFLQMFIGYDLGVREVKALTSKGARKLSTFGNRKGNGKFCYTNLFKGVGFNESKDPNWMKMERDDFYRSIETDGLSKGTSIQEDQEGLRRYETRGLDAIIEAFRNLKPAKGRDEDVSLGIQIREAQDLTRDELEKAISTSRTIEGRHQSSPWFT